MHKKIEKISKEKLIQSNKFKFKMDYTPPKYYSSWSSPFLCVNSLSVY